MKKILLLVMTLVCICGSCFANSETLDWVSYGGKWDFASNGIAVTTNEGNIGFNDTRIVVALRKSRNHNISAGAAFYPHSLSPYVLQVEKMFVMNRAGKEREVPPNPVSFEDKELAKAICGYLGIEIR